MGRTGTLITIDMALEQAAKEGTVDIPAVVSKIRRQRMKMVQTVVSKLYRHAIYQGCSSRPTCAHSLLIDIRY